jgi:hypothetical protein
VCMNVDVELQVLMARCPEDLIYRDLAGVTTTIAARRLSNCWLRRSPMGSPTLPRHSSQLWSVQVPTIYVKEREHYRSYFGEK